MKHISTTPFGRRPVTAGLLADRTLAEAPIPDDTPDKWTILKDLTAARLYFGVTDRDLAVLAALISFHPGTSLADGDGTIVFPSNAALSERAHGMAESTLRRHLAALVAAGLILRHDSPNGKRYAARDETGRVARAFGFDLRPLLVRANEITQAATEARAMTARLKRLREAAVLRLRDAAKLMAYGRDEALPGPWEALEHRLKLLQKGLRRKLPAEDLEGLGGDAEHLLDEVNALLVPQKTQETSGNDENNERHIQYSNRLPLESELSKEMEKAEPVVSNPLASDGPKLPIYLVLKACPNVKDYVPDSIQHWHELVAAANFIRPMLGISSDAWEEAKTVMGSTEAAITLVAMLQRADHINKPGGYLRTLTEKAQNGTFSTGPMIMALLRAENGTPA